MILGNTAITVLENGNLSFRIPITFRRRYGRKTIIPPPSQQQDETNPDLELDDCPMMKAIARAHAWTALIEKRREVDSVSELARKLKVDASYVTRILTLSTLAPDIVEAIVQGNAPESLSLTKLLKPFPEEWVEQKRHFGVA